MAPVQFHFAYFSYLFVFSIDVHCLGADGLADVVDVVFSAVVKDVFILFPKSDREIETEREREKDGKTYSQLYFLDHHL